MSGDVWLRNIAAVNLLYSLSYFFFLHPPRYNVSLKVMFLICALSVFEQRGVCFCCMT